MGGGEEMRFMKLSANCQTGGNLDGDSGVEEGRSAGTA